MTTHTKPKAEKKCICVHQKYKDGRKLRIENHLCPQHGVCTQSTTPKTNGWEIKPKEWENVIRRFNRKFGWWFEDLLNENMSDSGKKELIDFIHQAILSAEERGRKEVVEEIKYKFVGLWPNEKLMRGTINGFYTAEQVVESMFRLLETIQENGNK